MFPPGFATTCKTICCIALAKEYAIVSLNKDQFILKSDNLNLKNQSQSFIIRLEDKFGNK